MSANVFIAVCDLTRLFADRFCIVLRLFDLIGLTGYSARIHVGFDTWLNGQILAVPGEGQFVICILEHGVQCNFIFD